MTTAELIARLRELDPAGTMPVVIADDMGISERDEPERARMVEYDEGLWAYSFRPNDPNAKEVIVL